MGVLLARFATSPPPDCLKDRLMAEIERRRSQNHLPIRGGFLTLGYIDELFTVEGISQQLQKYEEFQRISKAKRAELALFIKENQQKLYAILLLMDQSHHLISDKARAFTDKYLFAIQKPGLASLPCPLSTLETLPLFRGFASAFYEQQYVFPPSLSTPETVKHPLHFKFPFANERERVGNGSFGEVYRVEIPRGFLLPLADEDVSKNVVVAYKRIRRQATKAWEKVDSEVKVLHQRPHRNITPLWGSFFAGLEETREARSSAQCLYLLSPAATMSMQGWMSDEKAVAADISSGFIYFDTMMALASGLTYIHREIDTMVAYHRDIKPSNILLFQNKDGKIWKFCDFGTSNLKRVDNTGTESMVTDKYWAPPEFFEDHSNENGITHARTHDVFSLGCVFLELATLLHMGADGRDKFEILRVEEDRDPQALGYRGAFHRSMPAVRRWIGKLRDIHEEEQSRDVLALISDMLQPIDERIYSWEVEIDLFILGPSGGDSVKVVDYLRQIGHRSIGYSARTKHNPYTRAKKRAKENQLYGVRCANQFFQVMETLRWHEYSPQSTGSFQQTPGQQVYSNISLAQEDDILCGGQTLYQEISNSFHKSDIVALYGVAGIGKTRNALEYARQFLSPVDQTLTRHTFIVDATSADSLWNSYDAIADTISQSSIGDKVTKATLGSWLENSKTGKWFIVVDGFNPTDDINELKKMLPTPRRSIDQILITTRDRAIVDKYSINEARVPPCIEVCALTSADSMRFFKQNIEEWKRLKSNEVDTTMIESLLKELWSPAMIRYAAVHMEEDRMDTVQMQELVDENGLSVIRTPFPSYLEYVLQPLAGTLSRPGTWPREVGTLFLLAFFDPRGVEWSTLRNNHATKRKRLGLLKSLGRLQDCGLIEKASCDIGPVYSIRGNIRRAIMEWIEQHDGPEGRAEGFLNRYSKALSITYKSYHSSLKAAKATIVDTFSGAHQSEEPFMPHFRCFVQFTIEYPQQQKPLMHHLAVQAVISFSKVLLEQDRYREAITVTEYTRKHYKYKLDEDDSEKQVQVFFTLGRHLVTIYLACPRDTLTNGYRSKASELISDLRSDIKKLKGSYSGQAWMTLINLEIKLDEVRMYRQSAIYDQAHRKLSDVSDAVNAMINSGDRVIQETYEHIIFRDGNRRTPLAPLSPRKLQIMANFQDGLLHLAEGSSRPRTDRKCTLEFWNRARELLMSTESAFEQYCASDELWHDDIRVASAVVNTRIGGKGLIRDAIYTLELVRGRMEDRYGLVRRTMDVERRLNEARLQSNKQHVKIAIESLRELLEWYTDNFGKYASHGEYTTCTKTCASLLVRALRRMGKRDEASELRKTYRLEAEPSEEESSWVRQEVLLKVSIFVVVVLLYLGYSYQNL